jgi:hypothetical protein
MSNFSIANNLFPVDGQSFEGRFDIQGSGSIVQCETLDANGYIFVIGFNASLTTALTSANLYAVDNLPTGSVIFDAAGSSIYMKSVGTWTRLSASGSVAP